MKSKNCSRSWENHHTWLQLQMRLFPPWNNCSQQFQHNLGLKKVHIYLCHVFISVVELVKYVTLSLWLFYKFRTPWIRLCMQINVSSPTFWLFPLVGSFHCLMQTRYLFWAWACKNKVNLLFGVPSCTATVVTIIQNLLHHLLRLPLQFGSDCSFL